MPPRRTATRKCFRESSRLATLGLLACAGIAVQAHAAASSAPRHAQLQAGKSHFERGEWANAYTTLEPLEAALAGNVEYDLVFGQTALAVNRPSRAAFAFERCLAVNPLNGTCRLGMARAHMMLAEYSGARNELDLIARSRPPVQVQRAVDEYLAELTNRQAQGQDTRLRGYAQVGIGYDSNFNHASTQDALALPLFNNAVFRLSRDGQARESGFNQAQLNISYSTPVNANWRFLVDTSLASSLYWETDEYNTLISDLGVGISYRRDAHQFTVKALGQNYQLGNRSYRNLIGVLGQYAYTVNERAEVNAFANVSRLNYPQEDLRNAHRYTLGMSWSQMAFNDKAVLYASAYGGREDAVKNHAPDTLDYGFGGVRLGGMALLNPRTQVEFGAGAEQRRYDGSDTIFLTQRKETVYDVNLGVNYALNRKWSVRPAYRYTLSDSSIPLRDYQRHAMTLNLRYELF